MAESDDGEICGHGGPSLPFPGMHEGAVRASPVDDWSWRNVRLGVYMTDMSHCEVVVAVVLSTAGG
ncbi:hypothetical protein Slala02_22460 [Streptomyces lavendulae subsp. lavendulae]|nr:hypothetical protein Slala01_17260 [Streptomyces lavendulae subsp. lavendulae]GLX26426.1 hypothetical protein Slala02_22460 [Streptomyces lavendulae subsp. lavendulae]